MRKHIVCLALGFAGLFVGIQNLFADPFTGFDDILLWAGDGKSATNRAALIIQWNPVGGSSQSLVWGYGWNVGTRTGWDMLMAVQSLDMRLQVVEHPSVPTAIFGIAYDWLDNGSGFTSGGPMDLGGDESGAPNDPGNYYQEGWYTGFWEYNVFGGNFTYDIYGGPPDYEYLGQGTYNQAGAPDYASVSWFSAPFGPNWRDLEDGYWDALSFAPGFASEPVQTPLAIPEPTALGLLLLGVTAYAFKRVYRH